MSDAAKAEHEAKYGKDQVVKIISSVIAKVQGVGEVSRETLYAELSELQAVIDEARKEIGSARPADIGDKHIPTATDELDAVVEATAEATGKIMDSCDVIMEKGGEIGGDSGDALVGEVTKIYEACSFQDITGQRITKVVATLKTIEDKVDRLMHIVGAKLPGIEHQEGEEEDKRSGDEKLLNGPQMAEDAVSQDDIDKILEQFD